MRERLDLARIAGWRWGNEGYIRGVLFFDLPGRIRGVGARGHVPQLTRESLGLLLIACGTWTLITRRPWRGPGFIPGLFSLEPVEQSGMREPPIVADAARRYTMGFREFADHAGGHAQHRRSLLKIEDFLARRGLGRKGVVRDGLGRAGEGRETQRTRNE